MKRKNRSRTVPWPAGCSWAKAVGMSSQSRKPRPHVDGARYAAEIDPKFESGLRARSKEWELGSRALGAMWTSRSRVRTTCYTTLARPAWEQRTGIICLDQFWTVIRTCMTIPTFSGCRRLRCQMN